MTRDFKQNEATAPSNQYGISWVLGGIAVGLLAGAVVYALMSRPELATFNLPIGSANPNSTQQNTANSTTIALPESTTQTALEQQPGPEDDRPGFSYHAVLPQLEVNVPVAAPNESAPQNQQKLPQIEPQANQNQQQQPAANNNQDGYMFQLGAYRNRNQAVQMQNNARQNGMNTRIETAQINGQTWFRVRLGPTDNLQIVNRWKQRLNGMGINPMMIRL